YSTFLLASLLLKTVYTNVLIIIFVVTLLCDTVGKVKLMMQKKVKARMTPSKSWTTLRRKRDQKSYLRPCLTFEISNSDTLKGVLTESGEFNSAFPLFILHCGIG
ncbi:hypothetical protein T4D_2261, partial [Trichinella pseudospiralis]